MTLVELVHFGILKFAFPASQHFGIWYCYLHQVVGPLGMFRETIHTFTLSVYRYVFIIHRESIRTDKRRNEISWTIFGMKWLVVCILTAKWGIFNKDDLTLYWTGVCMGNSTLYRPTNAANANYIEYALEGLFYRVTKTSDRALITNLGNVEGYFTYPLKAFCVVAGILQLVTCLNFMEGFLYGQIAHYMKS